MSKIICHFCGGAAISISEKVFTRVEKLGDGFAEIEYNYLDTSDANIRHNPELKKDFYLMVPKRHGSSIDGSGGERSRHITDIFENVSNYLNEKKIIKQESQQYHLVVFGPGGSGGGIGAAIVKSLLEKNIGVLVLMVGDSSNELGVKNTINNLASIDNIARHCKKALPLIYVNNHSYMKNGSLKAEIDANECIFTIMSTVSLFLSGKNEAIDYQDMLGMLNPSSYTSINIPEGVYGLVVQPDWKEIDKHSVPRICRVLTDGTDFTIPVNLGHQKIGKVISKNARKVYDNKFPIFMVLYANYMVAESIALKGIADSYIEAGKAFNTASIAGVSDSKVDNDTGLVF